MAYRIECELRADDAEFVIHPEMGWGQSNLCEASFLHPHSFLCKASEPMEV